MLVLGLTGGIACGKSTVSRRLREKHKLAIIDADQVARDVVEPGQDAYNRILDAFNGKVSNLTLPDGHLNRGALGRWVFEHPDDLKKLNCITHPAVRYGIFKKILVCYLCGYRMCVLDVPLLYEAGLDRLCGITVTVVSDQEQQVERILVRNPGMTREDALNRIKAQMTTEERIERADYVLENNRDVPYLFRQVDELVAKVNPTLLRTVLEYFPPFGAVSAAALVLSKSFLNSHKRKMQ
ncbi:hypothetical protein HG536_0C00510 [Torulaspora globosa]|uniref:Dephospho-CoA kinase n=1 Tax=Torulaspora globosa TaxID=48254 RepID=A0A7G3ZEE8_9SACH|nr:uncharacterized protein HG536_0C00510 [Torulaspora globosa]QLL31884.1 hypothetical protein HG536_0C00510 [Torulaspora globosa]